MMSRMPIIVKLFQKSVVLASFVLVVLAGIGDLNASTFQNSPAAESGSTPKISFRSTSVHVGLTKPGNKAQGEFIVENKGNADLVLKRVAPT